MLGGRAARGKSVPAAFVAFGRIWRRRGDGMRFCERAIPALSAEIAGGKRRFDDGDNRAMSEIVSRAVCVTELCTALLQKQGLLFATALFGLLCSKLQERVPSSADTRSSNLAGFGYQDFVLCL
jgi:hypothetical protein